MASSESRLAALFTEDVSSSAEGELAIDETTSTVSLVPNVCVVPGVSAVVEEDEKCVGETGDALSAEESTVGYHEGEGDENDSFVDIMSGISAAGGAQSEGWTFADALVRANLSVETLAEGVVDDASRLPTRESSSFISHLISFLFAGFIWWPLIFSIS